MIFSFFLLFLANGKKNTIRMSDKQINNTEWLCWNKMAQRNTNMGQKYYHTFPETNEESKNIITLRGKVLQPLSFQFTRLTNVENTIADKIYCKKIRVNDNSCGDCNQTNKKKEANAMMIIQPNDNYLQYKVNQSINFVIIFCTILIWFLLVANIHMILRVLSLHTELSDSEFVSKVKFDRKWYVFLFYLLSVMALGVGIYIICAVFEAFRNKCTVFDRYKYKKGNETYAEKRLDMTWDDGKVGKWVIRFMLIALIFCVVAFYNMLDHLALPATQSQTGYMATIAVLLFVIIIMWVYYFLRHFF